LFSTLKAARGVAEPGAVCSSSGASKSGISLPDESHVEPALLPDGDALDVDPVLCLTRERLEDTEIFSTRAGRRPATTKGEDH
jgi:hypothetical protein